MRKIKRYHGYPWLTLILLLAAAMLLWLFSLSPYAVETFYSTGFYPSLSSAIRLVQGFIRFSLGDILYAWAFIWLIRHLVLFIMKIFRRQAGTDYLLNSLRRNINRALAIYIVFNFLWGLNYDRLGIAHQLQIEPDRYDTADLKNITGELIQKVNFYRTELNRQQHRYPPYSTIFDAAIAAYQGVADSFPFLQYVNPSVKRSLYGKAGNYLGFLGYLNPFTGESQVNVTAPAFVLPFVTCHEIAHQLGYSSESEANFTGYLAARQSNDPFFNYSVYFDLFNYANNELFYRDSVAARANYRQLDTLVKLDIKAYRRYQRAYQNPVEPLIKVFYSNYLKANNQPRGIDSYNEVVSWLIAYRKKYGRI